jgi:hypothetical protein
MGKNPRPHSRARLPTAPKIENQPRIARNLAPEARCRDGSMPKMPFHNHQQCHYVLPYSSPLLLRIRFGGVDDLSPLKSY